MEPITTGVYVAMQSALKYGASLVVKDLLKTILPSQLSKNISKTLQTFKKNLPTELSEGFDPESLISGLHPDSPKFDSDSAPWREIHLAIAKHSIPSKDEWYDALRHRWEVVHALGKHESVQDFYKVASDSVIPYLLSLSGDLVACCSWEEKLAYPTIINSLVSLHGKVDDLAGPNRDPADQKLNSGKALLDKCDYEAVIREMDSLEASVWGDLTSWQKWRLRNLKASALLRLGKTIVAGQMFVEARQYAKDVEKARINYAVGLELLMRTAESHAECLELLKEYPESTHLFATFLRTLPPDSDFKAFIDATTPAQMEDEEVLAAMSQIAGYLRDFPKQCEIAQKLVEKSPKWAGAHWCLAIATQNKGWYSIDSGDRVRLLREAIGYYSKTIEVARERNDKPMESRALLSRGNLLDYLGDSLAAVNDFEAAFKADPNDPSVARKHAFLLIGEKKYDDAIKRARVAYQTLPNEETAFALSVALKERGASNDAQEAYELISSFVATENEVNSIVLELAIHLAAELQGEKARELIDSAAKKVPPIAEATIRSQLEIILGNQNEAIKEAKRATELLSDQAEPADRHRLANQLGRLGLFKEAVPVFETITTPCIYDSNMIALIDCAIHAEREDVLLKTFKALRDAGVRNESLLHNEVLVLRKYSPEKAESLLRQILNEDPTNKQARLHLSVVGLEQLKPDLLCGDPALLPDVLEKHPNHVGVQVVGVLLKAGNSEAAIKAAYRLVRGRFDDYLSHQTLLYCFWHKQTPSAEMPLLKEPTTVGIGTVVTLQNLSTGHVDTIIIEDDENPRMQAGEYAPDHPMSKLLLGAKANDVVIDAFGHEFKVTELRNKYVYMLFGCLSQYSKHFQGRTEIRRFSVVDPTNKTDKGILEIQALMQVQRDGMAEELDGYRDGPLPLGYTSERLGRHVFELLGHLIYGNEGRSILCCMGNGPERAQALASLQAAQEIVFTLTALFAVVHLDLLDVLARWPQRLVLSPGTLQSLNKFIDERKDPGDIHADLDESGKFKVVGTNKAAILNTLQKYRRLVEIIKERFQIVPSEALANLDPDERNRLVKMFGWAGAESVVLANDPTRLLWTDDYVMGIYGSETFGIKWAWTQATLDHAVTTGSLDLPTFNRASARLLVSRYRFTWWNEDIFIQAAEDACFDPRSTPLKEFISDLGNENIVLPDRVAICGRLMVALFKKAPNAILRNAIIVLMADRVTGRESVAMIYKAFVWIIMGFCQTEKASGDELRQVLRIWMQWRTDEFLREVYYCDQSALGLS